MYRKQYSYVNMVFALGLIRSLHFHIVIVSSFGDSWVSFYSAILFALDISLKLLCILPYLFILCTEWIRIPVGKQHTTVHKPSLISVFCIWSLLTLNVWFLKKGGNWNLFLYACDNPPLWALPSIWTTTFTAETAIPCCRRQLLSQWGIDKPIMFDHGVWRDLSTGWLSSASCHGSFWPDMRKELFGLLWC